MNSFHIVVVKVDSKQKVGQVRLITSANKFTENWKNKNQKFNGVHLNQAVFLNDSTFSLKAVTGKIYRPQYFLLVPKIAWNS